MAKFNGELSNEVIKMFEELQMDSEKIFSEMVSEGAKVVKNNVSSKMPKTLKNGLGNDNLKVTRVYKTPYDDGINCKVMIQGYFINRYGHKTPAPLVANLFEYGRSNSPYPKQPFMRSSFNKSQIEQAMLKAQEKEFERISKNWGKLFR